MSPVLPPRPVPLPLLLVLLGGLLAAGVRAELAEFDLTISYGELRPTGETRRVMVVNGGIPAPTLEFTEGDDVVIRVRNQLDEDTSIHWHGLLLPNRQDGVPNLTTHPIEPGTTHTFRFPAIQSGTYWYHSHTRLQEERGMYGGIIIHPKERAEEAPRDEMVVLSDWIDENPERVLRTLKRGNDWYGAKKGSRQNLMDALRRGKFGAYFRRAWSRMHGVDVSDVAYDAYLVNGERQHRIQGAPGERIRLRVVNGSASTYFFLHAANQPLRVVAADGIDVEPVDLDRLLIGIAETYDVVVQVPETGALELLATAQDGSGAGSLILGDGPVHHAERVPPPDFYELSDPANMPHMKVTGIGMVMKGDMPLDRQAAMMNDYGATPERPRAPYDQLRALEDTSLPEDREWREYTFHLQGDMDRYVWQLNGQVLSESDKVRIRQGENVRFRLVNQTMMHHPMHLHGHFFRVVNRQGERSPLKHTVDVPPMGVRVIEFAANEKADWFFHCHVLYHMDTGMARVVSYADAPPDDDILAIQPRLFREKSWDWGYAAVLGQMVEVGFESATTRRSQRLRLEADYEGAAELEFFLERYSNRFWTTFIGMDAEKGHEGSEAVGVAGLRTLLPLNLHLTLWVDHQGDARAITAWEVAITRRLSAHWMMEYDTEAGNEWEVELDYMLGRDLSLVWRRDSHFGSGIGLATRF